MNTLPKSTTNRNASLEGTFIDTSQKWKLGPQLGSGACGTVYALHRHSSTKDSKQNHSFVIKIAPIPPSSSASKSKKRKKTAEEKNADLLFHEHILYLNVLNTLRGSMVPEIPLPGYSSSVPPSCGEFSCSADSKDSMKYRYLIMERMQDTFTSYLIPRILQNPILLSHVFVRLIQLMKNIHDLNYVFIDVKPENFMIAKHTTTTSASTTKDILHIAQQIRMIDVALMESTKDIMRNGKHRLDAYPDGQMVGTPTYASRNVMKGHTPSRRDDLEAIAYVILELMMQVGHLASSKKDIDVILPWSHGTSDEDVLQRKINAVEEKDQGVFWNAVEELIGTCAVNCMKEYLNIVSKLEFKEKPDYEALIRLASGIQLQLSNSATSTSSKRKTIRGGTLEDTKTVHRKKRTTTKTTTTQTKIKKSPSVDIVPSPRTIRAATRSSRKERNQVIVLDNDDESSNTNSSQDVDMKPPSSTKEEEEETIEYMDWERTTAKITTSKPKPFLTIECTSGPHTGESCVLETSMIIGSHPKQNVSSCSSDHTIFPLSKESQASDNHVKLILSCSGGMRKGILMVKVMDMKSSTGTFINSKALPKGGSRQAFVNDCIKIGTSEFRIKKS
jgi:serine/threonine protein kinase